MSIRKYIVVGAISGIISFVGGINLAIYVERPHTAYEKRIEGDERQYLVIKSSSGKGLPMVRNASNEPFKRLDDVAEETLASEETKMQSLREKVLSK